MLNPENYIKVAAYQGPVIEKCPEKAIEVTLEAMNIAQKDLVDILVMPESFLHGYLGSGKEAKDFSLDLQSSAFDDLCSKFSGFTTTLLLGINERQGDKIYNSVVVVEDGQLLGVYRKAHTYPPFDYFSLGMEFPVFEKKGISYGVVICFDSVFFEPARILALKGAKIIFCPMFNRIPTGSKMPYFMNQKSHFIARSFENHCWIVASDVIHEDEKSYCAGHACVLNSDGEIVVQSERFTENLLQYSIPIKKLKENKTNRLLGNVVLNEIMMQEYSNLRKRL